LCDACMYLRGPAEHQAYRCNPGPNVVWIRHVQVQGMNVPVSCQAHGQLFMCKVKGGNVPVHQVYHRHCSKCSTRRILLVANHATCDMAACRLSTQIAWLVAVLLSVDKETGRCADGKLWDAACSTFLVAVGWITADWLAGILRTGLLHC
jgi:hypothetical protein